MSPLTSLHNDMYTHEVLGTTRNSTDVWHSLVHTIYFISITNVLVILVIFLNKHLSLRYRSHVLVCIACFKCLFNDYFQIRTETYSVYIIMYTRKMNICLAHSKSHFWTQFFFWQIFYFDTSMSFDSSFGVEHYFHFDFPYFCHIKTIGISQMLLHKLHTGLITAFFV